MPQTLSVIKADVGGYVGHTAMHPELLDSGRESLAQAVQSGLLIDAQAHACGDDLFLVMSHDRGEDDEAIHRLAWDTFQTGTEVALKLHLYGAGQDILVDAFSGNIRGAGPGSAELELEERPSEPVIVFMGDKTSSGSFNLPFYKMFADPFNTAGLVIAESLHQGFNFEVHDLKEHKRIHFDCPDDLYDLLVFIGSPAHFAVKRVRSRSTGEVAAVSSTDKLSLIAGRYVGKDDPTAIVRCQGNFPRRRRGDRAVHDRLDRRGLHARLALRPVDADLGRAGPSGALRRPAAACGARLPARGRQADRPARPLRRPLVRQRARRGEPGQRLPAQARPLRAAPPAARRDGVHDDAGRRRHAP